MSDRHLISKDDWVRIDRLLAGSGNDDDVKSLEASLRGNRAAQKVMLDYCQMHIDLSIDIRAESAGAAAQDKSQVPVVFSGLGSVSHWPWIVGGVLMTVLATVIGFWQIGELFPSKSQLPRADAKQSIAVSRPFERQSINLRSGTADLRLPGVGSVVVQGPAEFDLLDAMRARLNYGRIKMRVTEKSGHGFVIETPDGEITDLGTEFGVDVTNGRKSLLAVFEGTVDLMIADQPSGTLRIERLLGGDGVLFNRGGVIDRLGSIRTGDSATFAYADDDLRLDEDAPLIAQVYDNLSPRSTRRFYEIVPRGMKEDALAFVDRLEHNWNGLAREPGLPTYLVGADYVKTFNDDKQRVNESFKLTVVLNRPARLYIFFDKRLAVPDWLSDRFERLHDRVGLDTGRWNASETASDPGRVTGEGAGQSIDHEMTIWRLDVDRAGPVQLGENGINKNRSLPTHATMYGIVATEIGKKRSAKRVSATPERKSVTSSARSRDS